MSIIKEASLSILEMLHSISPEELKNMVIAYYHKEYEGDVSLLEKESMKLSLKYKTDYELWQGLAIIIGKSLEKDKVLTENTDLSKDL